MSDLASSLDEIEDRLDQGVYRPGPWSAFLRAADHRPRAERLALADRVSNQVFLSGFTVAKGAIIPTTTTLASGFTIQAAAWRWGEERAICAVTGLYTGEAVGAQGITQKVHRELPRRKTTERQWEAHEAKLDLPVREMLEFQNGAVGVVFNLEENSIGTVVLGDYLGIKEGDEVITTPFTFIATAEAIRYVGAKPVFVDIDPQTYNMDLQQAEAAITSRTRAILPVHIFGQPVDMATVMALADKHNLQVVEDCAQSFGAHIDD